MDNSAQRGGERAASQLFSMSGTLRRSSSSQRRAFPSDGARQSPRGESEPPEVTFGPFGDAERLNWLVVKKRNRKVSSHLRIVARS